MTTLLNNGGFTLIELLVVVLIIGILAAVALPQYQKAVMKSRLGQVHSVLRTLRTGIDNYILANGADGTIFLGYDEDKTSLLDINFGTQFDCSDHGDDIAEGCLLHDFVYRATTDYVEAYDKEQRFLIGYDNRGEQGWQPSCASGGEWAWICDYWNSL